MRSNVFADPRQINRHCGEKIGQKLRPGGAILNSSAACRLQAFFGVGSIESRFRFVNPFFRQQ